MLYVNYILINLEKNNKTQGIIKDQPEREKMKKEERLQNVWWNWQSRSLKIWKLENVWTIILRLSDLFTIPTLIHLPHLPIKLQFWTRIKKTLNWKVTKIIEDQNKNRLNILIILILLLVAKSIISQSVFRSCYLK